MTIASAQHNRTAELLTSQLPEIDMYSKTLVSGYTDITNQEQGTCFTSNTQDRLSMEKTPIITPVDIIDLPEIQAVALLEGGQLWKIRMPLPAADKTNLMQESCRRSLLRCAVITSLVKHGGLSLQVQNRREVNDATTQHHGGASTRSAA